MKLGMIGLDTSHVTAFTQLLNDSSNEYHVPGGRVVAAYPGEASRDFELSYSRVERFTKEMKENFGVRIADSAEAIADESDAVFLTSVDGRVHLELFRKIAPLGKPVFIDKPFAVSFADAREIVDLAGKYNVPLMSCSSLRYAETLTNVLANKEKGAVIGADFYGPMAIEPTQPGLFWYGIHTVEMLYRTFAKGCVQVMATSNDRYDVIVGVWENGRLGTIRGNRTGNYAFGGIVHFEKGSDFVDSAATPKPVYASMLENIMNMFHTGNQSIDLQETLEIIRFIEAANESRDTGRTVAL